MQENQTGKDVAGRLIRAFLQFKRLRSLEGPPGMHHAEHGNNHFQFHLKQSESMLIFALKENENTYPQGMTVSQISKLLQVKPPSITPVIRSLEEQGFIERITDPKDRRSVFIRPTEKADEYVHERYEHILTHIRGLVEYLGQEKSDQLATLLNDVYHYVIGSFKNR